jgi:dihydropteroate synthase
MEKIMQSDLSLVDRLRKRAEIRRQIPNRKSVQNNEHDRISDLLEESADVIEKYIKVLEDIANDYPELSHDKARMQNLDHIKWAKNVLKMFSCNGFCGEYECKENQANCKRIKK